MPPMDTTNGTSVLRSSKRRRFDRLEQAVSRMPLRADVLEEAWALFHLMGEFEDDERLVEAVIQRALRGGSAQDPAQMSELERLILMVVPPGGPEPKPDTVRERLFAEALCDDPYFCKLARLGIGILVCRGGDVCDPAFGAGKGIPKYGSVGMHVLGYPQRLATPPYEAQARRLFARMDDYRERVTDDSAAFFDRLTDATTELLWNGELPHDPFFGEGAILQAEFSCLWEHKRGKDVAAVMAAFDAVARAKGTRRNQALVRLQTLLREGVWHR